MLKTAMSQITIQCHLARVMPSRLVTGSSGSLRPQRGAIATSYACCQNVLTVGQDSKFQLYGLKGNAKDVLHLLLK